MLWSLALTAILVVGTEAFAPAPIQWGGLPARRFVVATKSFSSMGSAPAAQLMIKDQADQIYSSEMPYFSAMPDRTIAWKVPGVDDDLCIQSSGYKNGDVVFVSRCTGDSTQLWNVLPWGRGRKKQIQLKDTNACLDVNYKERDPNGASIELADCDSRITESWKLEEDFEHLGRRRVPRRATFALRDVIVSCIVLAALGTLSLGAWLRRWHRQPCKVLVDQEGVPLSMDQGGICLSLQSPVLDGSVPLFANIGSDARWMSPVPTTGSFPLTPNNGSSAEWIVPAAMAVATDVGVIRSQPADLGELARLLSTLLQLRASPLSLAEITDGIDHPIERPSDDSTSVISRFAMFCKRQRRSQLLVDLLKEDRAAYIESVSFLNIPREDLPNRQDIPLRDCDTNPRRSAAASTADGQDADELVADCMLEDTAMGENLVEAAVLEVTRNIYSEETGIVRNREDGIRGLIDEMRRYMLSPDGLTPAAQQEVLVRTLRKLMTPFLPPFYRVFMSGIVPSHDPDDKRVGADPKWLSDGVQWVRDKLPVGKEYLEPGRQLGPLPYAPALTSVVAPYAFGFLVGPSSLNRRSDGEVGGLVVEKCKFLQESNCKGMCLNSCKLPAQQLFDELGLSLRVSPNFETQECQWSFGEEAPAVAEDPTWPKGCIAGCTSREAMRDLRRASQQEENKRQDATANR